MACSPSKQSLREIFPKPRPPRAEHKLWEIRAWQEGRTLWAIPSAPPGSWGLLLRAEGGRAAAINRAQNSGQFKMVHYSQLNALMKSLSCNYSNHGMHSYPVKWHCLWNTVPLFWDKNEMPLSYSICTVKAQFWVEQKMHCHRNCFVWSVNRSSFSSSYEQYR